MTKPTADEIAETLRQAADVIRQRGWTRGELTNKGRVCAQAAIAIASGGILGKRNVAIVDPVCRLRFYGALDALSRSTGNVAVPAWNDTHSRKEVLTTLEQAAASVTA